MAADGHGRCEELRHPKSIELIISIIILVGILVSYLPQHIRIIQRRTAEGISPYYILLGTTSATAGFANILLLPQSRQDVACCSELETWNCLAGLLGIAQLGAQWICFGFIFVLFLVFFRYSTAVVARDELGERDNQPDWREVLLVSSLTLLHGLVVIVVTAILSAVAWSQLDLWATFLGLMAALLAAIQYLPQIWTTYHLKHVGSLSIPMMLLQTPGGFLFALSLFLRLGWAGWSSWSIYLLSALMQGTLLILAIYYEVQNRRNPRVVKSPAQPQEAHVHAYENILDDETPGRYENHPEHYANNPEHLPRILDRQDADAAAETTPLLKPGGIGNSSSTYTHGGGRS